MNGHFTLLCQNVKVDVPQIEFHENLKDCIGIEQ